MIPQIGPIAPGGPGPPISGDVRQSDAAPSFRPPATEAARPAAAETQRPALPPQAADRARQAVAEAPNPGAEPAVPPAVFSDPTAPAGPPPAFEASILDRARGAAQAVPVEAGPAEPVQQTDDSSAQAPVVSPRPEARPADPYEVPPSASERAAEQVAALRRIEMPLDTATVDVAR
ncbi:hypothetical protein [Ovoidimarina sediminis]|uniref:hypothetical protein n=1 Tax=Ovoidimarina sediminis TaxID=3079856 RepID=UPI0029127892|nr:hypothetical protein [Rhodophyticola sp. MJ-SS7]MDU8945114.1 hypothetical protein [Rhodophyticola sp. MJ-SS7]